MPQWRVVPSSLIAKNNTKTILLRIKGIIHRSCALYPAQAIQ